MKNKSYNSIFEKYIIFFDVGNTLIHTNRSVAEIYTEVASKYGNRIPPSELESPLREVWSNMLKEKVEGNMLRYGVDDESARQWWKAFVTGAFAKTSYQGNMENLFDELYDLFSTSKVWKLYDDALSTVDSFRLIGFKTGIISNWDIRLQKVLKDMGINKYFDYIFISCEIGFEKPDTRIFKYALDKTGFLPNNAFHIGDSFNEDVVGALN